jgi:murein tripeptide amidase MpaA
MALLMNTTEIESALVNFERTYPELCERLLLPERTCENRSCHALRIGKNYDPDDTRRPAVLIIGGVHAREWGGPDIIVNFVGDVLRAYSHGKGLQYGDKIISANEIKAILETITVFAFPCVNPDGVEFSHTATFMWRKNRNPARFNGDPDSIGVDINRNYDFLWDYKTCFHPQAWQDSSLASDDPLKETFHGDRPFSEPETRNVKWLMDNIPNLTVFLDLHSVAGDVLFSWGNDQNQSFDPSQTFTNRAYDGKRGLRDDSYGEYISTADLHTASSIATAIRNAIGAARGRPYTAVQAFGLGYPTSGASDDYAFSRHIVHPSLPRILAFTLEFNFKSDGKKPFLVTKDPAVLHNTMIDVIPGLLALCLEAPAALLRVAPVDRAVSGLQVVHQKGEAGEIWLGGADAKIQAPDPYRSLFANQVWHLMNAYEAIASMPGTAGEIAREGILSAMQRLAAEERKGGPGSNNK